MHTVKNDSLQENKVSNKKRKVSTDDGKKKPILPNPKKTAYKPAPTLECVYNSSKGKIILQQNFDPNFSCIAFYSIMILSY